MYIPLITFGIIWAAGVVAGLWCFRGDYFDKYLARRYKAWLAMCILGWPITTLRILWIILFHPQDPD